MLASTPVVPAAVTRPPAVTVPPPSTAINTLSSASAASTLLASNSAATSRLMAGMSPAGNIPSGASDQEKVKSKSISLIFNIHDNSMYENSFFLLNYSNTHKLIIDNDKKKTLNRYMFII